MTAYPLSLTRLCPARNQFTLREPSTFTDTTYQQNLRKQQSVESTTPKKIDYTLLVTNPLDDSAIRNNAGKHQSDPLNFAVS